MSDSKVENRVKVVARGELTSTKEIQTGEDKHRLACTIRTGPDEELPFSASHPATIARLKAMEPGTRLIVRGFATFRRDQLGGVEIAVNAWGDGLSYGVEPWDNTEDEPHALVVATGYLTQLEEDTRDE